MAHNYVGQIKVFLGRANEAAEHTLKAIQLSPRDPQLAEWHYQLAITYIHQQRYDEAVEWARRGVGILEPSKSKRTDLPAAAGACRLMPD
jgi:tetratricopeptide (TPR) repeat protein